MATEAHRTLLRRAGLLLLSWAALDIAYNVYSLLTAQSFKLGGAVLLIIAGALLMRGSLRWASWIVWSVALMLAWSAGSLLLALPLSRPADLWVAQLRLDAAATVMVVFMQIVTAAVLFWLYRQLQHAEVIAARRAAGQAAKVPRSAFMLGALLAVLTAAGLLVAQHGESGRQALLLAQQQLGSGYRYHVTAIRWSGTGATAEVTAFNDREIRNLQVAWSR